MVTPRLHFANYASLLLVVVSWGARVAYATPEIIISGIGFEKGSESWAIVEVKGRTGEVYYQGDEIPGIGTISAIHKNCVDIAIKAASPATVCLQGKQSSADTSSSLASQATRVEKMRSRARPHQIQTGELVELSVKDHQWLGQAGQGKTVYGPDGRASGFLLEQLDDASFLNNLKFQKGDLISALNGRPVHTLEDLSRAVLQYKGEVLEFEMKRDGESITRDIRISDKTLEDFSRLDKAF